MANKVEMLRCYIFEQWHDFSANAGKVSDNFLLCTIYDVATPI